MHEMLYRAGISGLSAVGYPDSEPEWFCMCGDWVFMAMRMSYRDSGNNLIEATRSFEFHIGRTYGEPAAAHPVDDDRSSGAA